MRKQMEEDRKNAATAVGLSLGGMGPSMSGGKAGVRSVPSCILLYLYDPAVIPGIS